MYSFLLHVEQLLNTTCKEKKFKLQIKLYAKLRHLFYSIYRTCKRFCYQFGRAKSLWFVVRSILVMTR